MNQDLDAIIHSLSTVDPSSSAGYELQKQFLEITKNLKLCESLLVSQHGHDLLTHHKHKLDDVWSTYERVFIASIESHQLHTANLCLKTLKTQFPTSGRVKMLEGMLLEAQGALRDAEGIYDSFIKKDPNNQSVWKRRVAVAKSKGDFVKAIDILTQYVKVFSSDEAAWMELVDLYLASNKLELAKFAMEELVLICPDHYLHHLLYAEILYTIGGKANVQLACQHYSQSLELHPASARALFGVIMCLRAKGSNLVRELHQWCGERVLRQYGAVLSAEAIKNFAEDNLVFRLGGDVASLPSAPLSEDQNPNPFQLHLLHASLH